MNLVQPVPAGYRCRFDWSPFARQSSPRLSASFIKTFALHDCLGFRRSIAFDVHSRRYQPDLKDDLFATKRGRGWQGRDLRKRTSKLLNCFDQR
jgi:hypothetical protein